MKNPYEKQIKWWLGEFCAENMAAWSAKKSVETLVYSSF